MDDNSQIYMIIAFLDTSYFFMVIMSYVEDIFQFMNKFYMSVFQITYEYHQNGLITRVSGYYKDFNDYFCATRSNMIFKELCDNYKSFHNAAIVYLSLTLVCLLLVLYGFIHFTGLSLN